MRLPSIRPTIRLLVYAATKEPSASLTIGLSNLLAPKGIRVNCVAPGPVWMPIQPIVKSLEQMEQISTNSLTITYVV